MTPDEQKQVERLAEEISVLHENALNGLLVAVTATDPSLTANMINSLMVIMEGMRVDQDLRYRELASVAGASDAAGKKNVVVRAQWLLQMLGSQQYATAGVEDSWLNELDGILATAKYSWIEAAHHIHPAILRKAFTSYQTWSELEGV